MILHMIKQISLIITVGACSALSAMQQEASLGVQSNKNETSLRDVVANLKKEIEQNLPLTNMLLYGFESEDLQNIIWKFKRFAQALHLHVFHVKITPNCLQRAPGQIEQQSLGLINDVFQAPSRSMIIIENVELFAQREQCEVFNVQKRLLNNFLVSTGHKDKKYIIVALANGAVKFFDERFVSRFVCCEVGKQKLV